MAGIYIHIPICATRCIYCDFYSTTLRGRGSELVEALTKEMAERRTFILEPVRTIYLGGGTPSQLGSQNIHDILKALSQHFDLSQCEEVTMEANPEDIASGLWETGRQGLLPGEELEVSVNRVSMGVQSMVDAELRLLHRRHDSQRVREAVKLLREKGIRNLSLDLMYGLPTQTIESWEYSIDQVLALRPEHISAYNLMVEEGTALYERVERGELTPCDDETCLAMAELLRKKLQAAGYEQYEISNYAQPGYYSRHNSAYWTQTPYLGLGPGAHSYDGRNRRTWNAPDLIAYLAGKRTEEDELLSETDLYNERVMLGLRTRKGIPVNELRNRSLLLKNTNLEPTMTSLLERGLIRLKEEDTPEGAQKYLCLTSAGLALADEVMRELMI